MADDKRAERKKRNENVYARASFRGTFVVKSAVFMYAHATTNKNAISSSLSSPRYIMYRALNGMYKIQIFIIIRRVFYILFFFLRSSSDGVKDVRVMVTRVLVYRTRREQCFQYTTLFRVPSH